MPSAERTRELRRWAASAPALAIIFAGLAIKGANDAALAALLSAALMVCLAASAAIAPRDALGDFFRANPISALAAFGFLGWAVYTASPLSIGLSHPLRESFGVGPGPASLSPYRTLEGAAAFLAPMAAFALGALAVRDRRDKDHIGRLIAALGLGFAVYAIALHTLSPDGRERRLMAHFGSANSAATAFAILACVSAALLLRVANGRMAAMRSLSRMPAALTPIFGAPLTAASLTLCVAALLLTASRAGLAAFACGMIMFTLLALLAARQRGGAAALATLAAGVIALGVIGGPFALQRAQNLTEDSLSRAVMAQTHLRAYEDRPLIGHGVNTFHELNQYYGEPDDYPALRIIGSAHNIYIQALEEGGQIGAALLALTLIPIAFRLVQFAATGRSGAEWAAGAAAALTAALLHGFVDFGLQTPAISALLAFILGAFSKSVDA